MAPQRFQRTAPSDLVRVGVITGPGGHTLNIWGKKMNPPPGGLRTTGMEDGQPTDSAFASPYTQAQLAEAAQMLSG